MSRCKSEEIKELLTPKYEKIEKKQGVKKTLSKSREITPTRKEISPGIYKSFSNEEKTGEKLVKFKEELERHVRASTTTLACHAAEDCMTKLRRSLTTEINKAYEKLYEAALQNLNQIMQEMYNSMGKKLLDELENNCAANGLVIPSPYILQNLHLPVHAKRGPPKLPSQNFVRIYDQLIKIPIKTTTNKDVNMSTEELEAELFGFIDKEVETLSQKLDIISAQQIKEEVNNRVSLITQFIVQEMENNISSMVSRLYLELQAVIEDRMQEILAANVQPMSRPPSAPTMPKLNLEGLNFTPNNTDFIQSIAKNYKK